MSNQAKVVQRGTHSFLTCPNCGKTLGEIVGVRLVIIVRRERVLTFPLVEDMQATCPSCGYVCAYRNEQRGVA